MARDRFPLLYREAAELFRRPRTFALQLAFLGGLVGVLAIYWPSRPDSDVTGRWLFKTLAAIQLATVALVAPALAAPSVARERERETLGLLAIAGVTSLRVTVAKALGRLSGLAVLVVLALPVTGALFLVGGLQWREVAAISLGSIALGTLGVGLGALFSATARRAETATLWAMVALGALAALPELVSTAGGGAFPAYLLSPTAWFRAVFGAYAETGEEQFRLIFVAPLAQAVLGIAATLLAALRLERTGPLPFHTTVARIPLAHKLLRLRKRGGPLGLTGRFGTQVAAIRWRERASRLLSDGALGVGLVLLVLLFEVLAPAGAAHQPARRELRETTLVTLAALATLLATTLGASAIAREREQETLEAVAAAPVEAEQFLLGKLTGLARGVFVVAGAVILHALLGALRGHLWDGVAEQPQASGTGPAPPILGALFEILAGRATAFAPGAPDLPWAEVFVIAAAMPFGLALHAVAGLSFSSHAETTIKAVSWAIAAAVATAAFSAMTCLFYGLSPPVFVVQVFRGSQGQLGVDPSGNFLRWFLCAVCAGIFTAAVAVIAWNHLRARFDQLVGRAALDIVELPDTIPEP